MQPYTNFQPMIQQPYQQPYNQFQSYQPMDRLSQLYAMQQGGAQPVPQFQNLNGRSVDNIESVVASEVPMDGTFAVFPRKDLSEVYVKYWTNEGKIATVRFKPDYNAPADNLSPEQKCDRFEEITAVLDGLYNKVDALSSRIDEVLKSKPSQSCRNKKEVTLDE